MIALFTLLSFVATRSLRRQFVVLCIDTIPEGTQVQGAAIRSYTELSGDTFKRGANIIIEAM